MVTDQSNWQKVKETIRALPADMVTYIEGILKESPEKVRYNRNNHGEGWYMTFYACGYEIEIIVERYYKRDNRIMAIAWNPEDSVVFMRDFVEEVKSQIL